MKRAISIGILLLLLLIPNNKAIAEPYPYELLQTIQALEQELLRLQAETEKLKAIEQEAYRLKTAYVPPSVLCSCVQTAKYLGVKIPMNTNAWDLVPNTSVPEVGQLVLMQYIKTGHVAVIVEIHDDGYTIVEGNYKTCQWTERFIPKDYYALKGFWTDGSELSLAK